MKGFLGKLKKIFIEWKQKKSAGKLFEICKTLWQSSSCCAWKKKLHLPATFLEQFNCCAALEKTFHISALGSKGQRLKIVNFSNRCSKTLAATHNNAKKLAWAAQVTEGQKLKKLETHVSILMKSSSRFFSWIFIDFNEEKMWCIIEFWIWMRLRDNNCNVPQIPWEITEFPSRIFDIFWPT